MENLLFESPYVIALLGLFAVGGLAYAWMQIGRRELWIASATTFLLTLLYVAINLYVETDREILKARLDEIAAAVETNDHAALYAIVHPNAVGALERAKSELPSYIFDEARITRIKEIQVDTDAEPPTAVAEFNAVVDVARQGQSFRVPRFVKLYFMKRDGQWMVRDYEHFEPSAGFRRSSAAP